MTARTRLTLQAWGSVALFYALLVWIVVEALA